MNELMYDVELTGTFDNVPVYSVIDSGIVAESPEAAAKWAIDRFCKNKATDYGWFLDTDKSVLGNMGDSIDAALEEDEAELVVGSEVRVRVSNMFTFNREDL
jgi:hypothetical protein